MKRMIFAGFFIAAMFLMVPKSYSQAVASFDAIILSSSMPPQMPDLAQPDCPQAGQLWQPGYWAYDSALSDYYWVPGDWVAPPQDDLVWTPGYWEFANNLYDFHPGYWGTDVGFYGGVNYGFGYFGAGYSGGTWKHHHFHYNTAVTHVDKKVVHETYVDNTVVVNNNAPNVHVSFNGKGGIVVKPRPEEERAMREQHYEPTQVQITYMQAARDNRSQFANFNHGRPTTTYLNKANTKTFITEATHNPMHSGGAANTRASVNNNRPNNPVNHGSHTGNNVARQQHQRTQHSSQHNSQQRQARTNQHSSTQHRAQPHTSQQVAQQHTNQRQQSHAQQKTPQYRTQQQHTQQPRTQQQHLQQQRAQPRVQQSKTQLLPHQKHT